MKDFQYFMLKYLSVVNITDKQFIDKTTMKYFLYVFRFLLLKVKMCRIWVESEVFMYRKSCIDYNIRCYECTTEIIPLMHRSFNFRGISCPTLIPQSTHLGAGSPSASHSIINGLSFSLACCAT